MQPYLQFTIYATCNVIYNLQFTLRVTLFTIYNSRYM